MEWNEFTIAWIKNRHKNWTNKQTFRCEWDNMPYTFEMLSKSIDFLLWLSSYCEPTKFSWHWRRTAFNKIVYKYYIVINRYKCIPVYISLYNNNKSNERQLLATTFIYSHKLYTLIYTMVFTSSVQNDRHCALWKTLHNDNEK